jgi:hypothetical protein
MHIFYSYSIDKPKRDSFSKTPGMAVPGVYFFIPWYFFFFLRPSHTDSRKNHPHTPACCLLLQPLQGSTLFISKYQIDTYGLILAENGVLSGNRLAFQNNFAAQSLLCTINVRSLPFTGSMVPD